jgi:hypothetical protein
MRPPMGLKFVYKSMDEVMQPKIAIDPRLESRGYPMYSIVSHR